MESFAFAAFAAALAVAALGPRDPALDVAAELNRLAPVPPPALEVRFTSLSGPEYALEELALELDGRPQKVPAPADVLSGAPLFTGAVAPGRHQLAARLTLVANFGAASYRTGYRFKLGKRISFEARNGLLHQIDLRAQRELSLAWEQSLDLAVARSERMVAVLESGEMPSPPRLPGPGALAAATKSGSKVDDAQPSEAATAAPLPAPQAAAQPTARRAPAVTRRAPPAAGVAKAAAPPVPPVASAEEPPALEVAAAPSPPPAEPVTIVQSLVEAQPATPAPAVAPRPAPWLLRAGAPAGAAALAVAAAGVALAAYRRRRRAGPEAPRPRGAV